MNDRYTIRCAVYLFLIKDNKILLLRRKNTGWEDGKYGVPAGHLEANEKIIDAAIRELQEETGVKTEKENLKFVHVMQRQSNFPYIDFFFVVNNWTGEPKINEQNMADDIGWFTLDNLPSPMLDNVKAGLDKYKSNILFSEFNL